jgi:TonB family protein
VAGRTTPADFSSSIPEMRLVLAALFLTVTSVRLFAQTASESTYRVAGAFHDETGAVVPGLRLTAQPKGLSTFTDFKGKFQLSLPVGEHILTIDGLVPEKFRVFLKVTDTGVNHGFLNFIVDRSSLPCGKDAVGNDLPKILESHMPSYPPAARAVRAGGEVEVTLEVANDGTVRSAKTIRGHPLLRAVSMTFAKQFRVEVDRTESTRPITLVFVFMFDTVENDGAPSYHCPYRILVPMPESTLYH